jgi:hypothetical protein
LARTTFFKQPTFLMDFITAHPLLSDDDKNIIKSWKNYIQDDFFLVKYETDHIFALAL